MKHKRTPAREYPARFFSELIAQHNWPPMFVPQFGVDTMEADRKRAAALAREVAVTKGLGWGVGTITLPNTPKTGPVGMMRRG